MLSLIKKNIAIYNIARRATVIVSDEMALGLFKKEDKLFVLIQNYQSSNHSGNPPAEREEKHNGH